MFDFIKKIFGFKTEAAPQAPYKVETPVAAPAPVVEQPKVEVKTEVAPAATAKKKPQGRKPQGQKPAVQKPQQPKPQTGNKPRGRKPKSKPQA